MRFTDRKDGRKHTVLTFRHHPGSVELAVIMCRYHRLFGFDGPDDTRDGITIGRALTRADLAESVRQAIDINGRRAYARPDWDEWAEHLSWRHTRAVVRWAVGTVRRLYPDLDDAALREWEASWAYTGKVCPNGCGPLEEAGEGWLYCTDCLNEWPTDEIEETTS